MANIVLPDEGWGQAFLMLIFAMAVLGVIALVAAQKPVLFRMGLRNVSRRPAQTSLVIGGLMIGTAILSGAFVTGDTMQFAIVKSSYSGADLIDEMVEVPGYLTYNYSVYENISADPGVKGVTDGISPMIFLYGVTIFDNNTGQLEPGVYVHCIDPAIDKQFGTFTTTGGSDIDGSDLSGNEIIMNDRLASALGAKTGDTLETYYQALMPATRGPPGPGGGATDIQMSLLKVKHIVRNEGKADYNNGEDIFMSLASGQAMFNATGRINVIKISNKGGVVEGAKGTNDAKAALEAALGKLGPGAGAIPAQFSVSTVKKAVVDIAESSSASLEDFLLLASSFTIIAGILLIINIFVMLAEERKKELGISRAVGMRRAHLVREFVFEGVSYSIIASIIGTFVGILIAYAMARGIFTAFGYGTQEVPFYWKNSSLAKAFSMGLLITLGTVGLASYRVSKLNIVRAIRSIEEPVKRQGTRRDLALGIVMLVLGVLFMLGGFVPGGSGILRLLGPNLFLFGIAFTIRRWTGPEVAYTFGGLAVLFYSMYFLFYGTLSESEGITGLVITGLLMVFGAVLALVSNSKVMVRGLGRLLGVTPRGKAVVVPAIAHPLNRGFRTGMTISMFSLILFIVVLFSIFFSVFTPNLSDEGGGYDLVGMSSVPVGDIHNLSVGGGGGLPVKYDTLNGKVEFVDGVAQYGFWGNFRVNNTEVLTYGPPFHYLMGVDGNFTSHMKYKLKDRDKNYATDANAWVAVVSDPNLALVDTTTASTQPPIRVGDVVDLPYTAGGNRTKGYKIVGIVDESLFAGLFVQKGTLMKEFVAVRGDNLFFIKVKAGEDQKQVAMGLESDFKVLGLNVLVMKEFLKTLNQGIQSVYQLFEMYMSLGLIVGIAALGVISVRAVIERKQEIGIMRALGYRRSMVLATFVIEMMFVTTMGIVIGVLIGWVAGYGIWKVSMEAMGVAFTVPWNRIGLTIAMTFAAGLLCTILPAYKASRTNPAEAIRWIE
jgi:putative ABC transport system permease protein